MSEENLRSGADDLVDNLLAGGCDTCFANPGTSEMHFVAALDNQPEMRCVLCLFEGVATGAADGYARMRHSPACTLLHLGPGLGNGLANLHNARKAQSALVNIVGEHALRHLALDAPLTSDIVGIARPVSDWVRVTTSSQRVGADARAALEAALISPGQVATLILPANCAWGPSADTPPLPPERHSPPRVGKTCLASALSALRRGEGEQVMLFLGGGAMYAGPLENAGRIAALTGCRVLGQRASARTERGAGRVDVGGLPYTVDAAQQSLAGVRQLILVGAEPPVAFFAYPDKPSVPTTPDCEIIRLASPNEDVAAALAELVDELGAQRMDASLTELSRSASPVSGVLDAAVIGAALSAALPEQAIVVNEAVTLAAPIFAATRSTVPHDWLQNMGGSIGYGMPLALGAAIACPDRKVVQLAADGSSLYTLQALWSQARENADIVTIILANRSYAILHHEFANLRHGQQPGPRARAMFDLVDPVIDWVGLAAGMGVPGVRVDEAGAFARSLDQSPSRARTIFD